MNKYLLYIEIAGDTLTKTVEAPDAAQAVADARAELLLGLLAEGTDAADAEHAVNALDITAEPFGDGAYILRPWDADDALAVSVN